MLHPGCTTYIFLLCSLTVEAVQHCCRHQSSADSLIEWLKSLCDVESPNEALRLGAILLTVTVLLVMGLTPCPVKAKLEGELPVSPWDTCSPLNRALLMFTLPLMFHSHRKPLQHSDIPDIPSADWPLQRFR